MRTQPNRWVCEVLTIEPGELPAALWSFFYFLFLLAGYYVIRPLREEMGIVGGVENLQWLFTATFAVMLLAVPLYGALVGRLAKQQFLPIVYHFFVANLLAFYLLMVSELAPLAIARIFFVWVSLFNLFAVSVFWSFMADLYSTERAKRLFGFIAAGGSCGALLGPLLTASLVGIIGPVNLLLVAILFLEAAVFCIHRLLRTLPKGRNRDNQRSGEAPPHGDQKLGSGVLTGITAIFSDRYLGGIATYILLFTTTSTFIYFQQAHIVAGAFDDPVARTRIFALIDFSVSALTLFIQILVASRIMRGLGTGIALAVLPAVTLVGFVCIAMAPQVLVIGLFQAGRRTANYGISRPARETLYTVVTPEQKYKAKSVIDTVVYRGGDAVAGWCFTGLSMLGLGVTGIALFSLPLVGLWLVLAFGLGRVQALRSKVGKVK